MYWSATKNLKFDADAFYKQTVAEITRVTQAAQRTESGTQPTPPMLPSPASIATANSANSTPSGAAPSPSTSTSGTTPPPPPGGYARFLPPELKEQFKNAPAAADRVTVPITPMQAQTLKNQTSSVVAAAQLADDAQSRLNLPILARHFPATFARVVHTSLSANEEWEPDFEDTEGELYWPSGFANGTGLGWVCLLGKSMVHEFGKNFGYQGIAGTVRKPGSAAASSSTPR
jgi:hypothetical protein